MGLNAENACLCNERAKQKGILQPTHRIAIKITYFIHNISKSEIFCFQFT